MPNIVSSVPGFACTMDTVKAVGSVMRVVGEFGSGQAGDACCIFWGQEFLQHAIRHS